MEGLKKSSQFVFLKEYTTETILNNVDQGIGIPLKWTEKNNSWRRAVQSTALQYQNKNNLTTKYSR